MPQGICSVPGCPRLAPCAVHRGPRSSRNHLGIPRQRRGHGAGYDAFVREVRRLELRCELAFPGCTVMATGGDYSVPGDWSSPLRPACSHCQDVQGGRLARGAA